MKEYVLGFAFELYTGRLALIRKQKPNYQKDKLNGIGGKIKFNEPPHSAMCREFEEEAALITSEDAWHLFCTMQFKDSVIHCFTGTFCSLYGVVTMETEQIEIHHIDAIPLHECMSSLSWLIPMALDDQIQHTVVNHVYNGSTESKARNTYVN